MAKKKSEMSKILFGILLGLLFVGLAGFGATNLRGSVRKIGSVGDKDIRVESYYQAIRSEMRAFEAQTGQPVTFAQAQAFGIPDRALAQLVTARALDNEAQTLGLSVGDENLAQQIRDIPAFKGADGSFDRDAYAYALKNNGLSEAEFEADLRDEAARSILQGAVLSGAMMPETYETTLLRFALETRDLTWVALDSGDMTTGLPVPSEDDLKTFYDANIADYTQPEARDITYAWITPDMILDTVEVDETAMQKAYADRAAEFNTPERRLVERLVYGSEADAQAAADRIAAGQTTFEDEVTARGLTLSDIDLGDVTAEDLGEAAAAVTAAEVGAVAGPANSDLGPALFRVNAILPAQETSFEDAKTALRADLALDRARRVIAQMADESEDMLAGGATLEDLAKDTEFELGQIAFSPVSNEAIAGYPAFREVAQAVTEDSYPTIAELADGGLFALRLNGITPAAPIPFDAVRDRVAADWDKAETRKALLVQGQSAAEAIAAGGDFAAAGLAQTETSAGLRRSTPVEGLPAAAMEAAFTMTPGQAQAFETETGAVVVRLDAVHAADLTGEDAKALAENLRDQANSALAQDIFSALVTDIQGRAGVQIDPQARTAVHTQIQ
ncbi:MAG: SurA N-terminal domain-containing protein [Roseivivax sp.]|nr:SurA N-terminal domain-containing protein [Roseivivax sp.]